jgi:hypothetical protein
MACHPGLMTRCAGIPHFDRQGHGLNRSVHLLFDVIQAELQLLLHTLAMGVSLSGAV